MTLYLWRPKMLIHKKKPVVFVFSELLLWIHIRWAQKTLRKIDGTSTVRTHKPYVLYILNDAQSFALIDRFRPWNLPLRRNRLSNWTKWNVMMSLVNGLDIPPSDSINAWHLSMLVRSSNLASTFLIQQGTTRYKGYDTIYIVLDLTQMENTC